MQLVSREVLFDVMKHKHDIKLVEDESTSAFEFLCSKANIEYKSASSKSKDRSIAMELFSNAMLRFMKDNKSQIRYVGQGSSRMVYAMADGTAIKIAKTTAGIAQNWRETKNCMDPNVQYAIFPDFYGADKKLWLTLNCELCAKAQKSDFKDILWAQSNVIVETIEFVFQTMGHSSLPLDVRLQNALEHYSSSYSFNPIKKKLLENIITEKTEAFKALKSLFDFYMDHSLDDMLVGDLVDVENWGIVERNREKALVVIDAGFSEDIYQGFYK